MQGVVSSALVISRRPLNRQQAPLTAADILGVVAMAWHDEVPFEAIAQQFGWGEPQVIALMRTHLKARSFPVWRIRVRGRSAKHRQGQASVDCTQNDANPTVRSWSADTGLA